jgi:D-amino-acid oxidase
MRVTVVGSGIIGLVCALRLRQAGHEVGVVAAEPPAETTSAVAAAIWYPYRAFPLSDVSRWAAQSYQDLAALAGDPLAGVRLRRGRELLRVAGPEPWWRDAVPVFGQLPASDLPPGYQQGWDLTLPVVDMPVHLDWLTRLLAVLGVGVSLRRVERLGDLLGDADVVVNCTGLGSATLEADRDLTPIRGQVVVVEQVGLEEWTLDSDDPEAPTYVVPRSRTIVCGGTAVDGDADLTVRPKTAEDVLRRCIELVPELAGAAVVGHRVGLRPGRSAVRLQAEARAGGRVVHCYGHGGAGVTLAYGCAVDVVSLVEM